MDLILASLRFIDFRGARKDPREDVGYSGVTNARLEHRPQDARVSRVSTEEGCPSLATQRLWLKIQNA